jgi:hypothetical protein
MPRLGFRKHVLDSVASPDDPELMQVISTRIMVSVIAFHVAQDDGDATIQSNAAQFSRRLRLMQINGADPGFRY